MTLSIYFVDHQREQESCKLNRNHASYQSCMRVINHACEVINHAYTSFLNFHACPQSALFKLT